MFDMVFMIALLTAAVRMAVPIAYAAIGEVISERSGILNVGVEGQMLSGAFIALIAAHASGSILVGVIAAGFGGALGALVIAYLCITRKEDQTVVGIIFNIFALGFTSYLFRAVFGITANPPTITTIKAVAIPGLSEIPVLGEVLFNQNVMVYGVMILAVLVWLVLFKIKVGLQVRAVGENPRAAQAAGIPVIAVRYCALLAGGFLAGIGGAFLTVSVLGRFIENVSAGRGFIALAVTIFSRWNPLAALGGALVFGLADALQLRLQAFGIKIPYQFLLMLPYLLTLLSLITVGRRVRGPRALGQVYEREGR